MLPKHMCRELRPQNSIIGRLRFNDKVKVVHKLTLLLDYFGFVYVCPPWPPSRACFQPCQDVMYQERSIDTAPCHWIFHLQNSELNIIYSIFVINYCLWHFVIAIGKSMEGTKWGGLKEEGRSLNSRIWGINFVNVFYPFSQFGSEKSPRGSLIWSLTPQMVSEKVLKALVAGVGVGDTELKEVGSYGVCYP